jgi:hypothetical protein
VCSHAWISIQDAAHCKAEVTAARIRPYGYQTRLSCIRLWYSAVAGWCDPARATPQQVSFMQAECTATCGFCRTPVVPPTATCVDADPQCAAWKAAGMADPRVLAVLGVEHGMRAVFACAGACVGIKDFMASNCPASCGACSGVTLAPEPSVTYSYVPSPWSGCSVSCGNGFQARSVTCTGSNGITYDNSFCANSDAMPANQQACAQPACVAPATAAPTMGFVPVTYGCVQPLDLKGWVPQIVTNNIAVPQQMGGAWSWHCVLCNALVRGDAALSRL